MSDHLAIGSTQPATDRIPLVNWVWRSYFRTSLIPLLIVEVALIAIYFLSNAISSRVNIDTVRTLAEQSVSQTAQYQAAIINRQFEGVTRATEYLRQQTGLVMSGKIKADRDDPSRFAYAKDGAFYTTRDNGGGAVFYSGLVPVGPAEREKAYRSAGLDASYKGIKNAYPLVVQVYFNTHDSLNRIYPYFDVLGQYPAKMDIPSYNFYYEADLKHNPERKVVWTEVYVDPAGQGWMISAIAPVYSGEFLEGVVGADVTVNTIIKDVLDLEIPWNGYGLLVSRSGTIIALPKAGESDWGLREVTNHQYVEAVKKDILKPVEFNLFERAKDPRFAKALRDQANGMMHVTLKGKHIVSWSTIPETGWKLLVTVPEHEVYAPAQSLADRLNRLAWLMVGGMLLFYLIFFTVLWRRARQMSEFISQPLQHIDGMVRDVAAGNFQQAVPEFQVEELSRTAQGIVQMGSQLDAAGKSRDQAQQALNAFSEQMRSVFGLSPGGFVSINAEGRVALVNPAFCRMTGREADDWTALSEADFWRRLAELSDSPSTGIGNQQSFRLTLKPPRHRVLQCEVRGAETGGGTDVGKVVYLHDMTREAELDRMKSQFLATAAHELRTPLTGVLGYAELLGNDKIPADKRAVAAQIIVKQSQWLVKIVNELLDLARLEGGAVELDIRSHPAALLLQEALDAFPVPAERTTVIVGDVPDVEVSADAAKFKVALVHVLDNAYRFSSRGNVSVAVLRRDLGGTPRVGFCVRDAGIGMTDDQVERIFDRFWRADTSGTLPGTGLGMSLVQEIMRRLGGEIEVESELGKGTAVTLWLPQIER